MAVRNEKSERRNASKRAYFTALRTLCHDFVRELTFFFSEATADRFLGRAFQSMTASFADIDAAGHARICAEFTSQ
jgi:hypothetical protein